MSSYRGSLTDAPRVKKAQAIQLEPQTLQNWMSTLSTVLDSISAIQEEELLEQEFASAERLKESADGVASVLEELINYIED